MPNRVLRRSATAGSVLALVLVGWVPVASSAPVPSAPPPSAPVPSASVPSTPLPSVPSTTPGTATPAPAVDVAAGPDFDGDGYGDVAMSSPGACFSCRIASGAVEVVYGSGAGPELERRQRFWPGGPGMVGDGDDAREFGRRVVWGDFDADGFDDLAVSAPEEHVDAKIEAGTVRVIYGSASGLTTSGDQQWSLDDPGIEGDATEGDLFGNDLATGDFDGDGHDDLAVLSGDRDESGRGPSVRVLYGSADGLSAVGSDQRRPGEVDDVRTVHLSAGDLDGDGLDELVVGLSSTRRDRGSVRVYRGEPSGLATSWFQRWSQDVVVGGEEVDGDGRARERFGWATAVADVDGDGTGDLVVGVRRERQAGTTYGGALHVLRGTPDGPTAASDQLVRLDPLGGGADLGDLWLVRGADVNADGADDLALGLETADRDRTSVDAVGAFVVLHGGADGLQTDVTTVWTQDTAGVYDAGNVGDRLGRGIGWSDLDGDSHPDLVIGAAFEDGDFTEPDHGMVHVFSGTPDGLTATGNLGWYPDDLGAPPGTTWTPSLRLGWDIS